MIIVDLILLFYAFRWELDKSILTTRIREVITI